MAVCRGFFENLSYVDFVGVCHYFSRPCASVLADVWPPVCHCFRASNRLLFAPNRWILYRNFVDLAPKLTDLPTRLRTECQYICTPNPWPGWDSPYICAAQYPPCAAIRSLRVSLDVFFVCRTTAP